MGAALVGTGAHADLSTKCNLRGADHRLVLENIELRIALDASEAATFTRSVVDFIDAEGLPHGPKFELVNCWSERLKDGAKTHPPQAEDFHEDRVVGLVEQQIAVYMWVRREDGEILIEFAVMPHMVEQKRYRRSFRLTIPLPAVTGRIELLKEAHSMVARPALIAGTLGWIHASVGQMQQNPLAIWEGKRCRLRDLRAAVEHTKTQLASTAAKPAELKGLRAWIETMEGRIGDLARRPEAHGCADSRLIVDLGRVR